MLLLPSQWLHVKCVLQKCNHHLSYSSCGRCDFSYRLTSCMFRREGAKNLSQMAAFAENVAAVIKSAVPAADFSRISMATSFGSFPAAVASSSLACRPPSPVRADLDKLVRMYPGEATWTETPLVANSALKASQYPWTANLEDA
jgi:hypothetical protein